MYLIQITESVPTAADFARRHDGEVLICINRATGYAYTYVGGAVVSLVAGGAAASVTLAMMANLATDTLIGRATAGTGVPEAITLTSAGRALIDDASAAAQRTTLGLGALAVQSGAVTVWTPTGNGVTLTVTSAGYLTLGSAVAAAFDVTWPVTADAGAARIEGLPTAAHATHKGAVVFGYTNLGTAFLGQVAAGSSVITLTDLAGVAITNATVSAKQFIGVALYLI